MCSRWEPVIFPWVVVGYAIPSPPSQQARGCSETPTVRLPSARTGAKAFSADLSPHQNTLSIAAADDLIAVGRLFSLSAS